MGQKDRRVIHDIRDLAGAMAMDELEPGGEEKIERRDRAPRGDDKPRDQRRERDHRRESRRESFPTETTETTTETEEAEGRSRQSGTTRKENFVTQNTERTPSPFGQALTLARKVKDRDEDMSALDAVMAQLTDTDRSKVANRLISELLEDPSASVPGVYRAARNARLSGRMSRALAVRRTRLTLTELVQLGIAEPVVEGTRNYFRWHLRPEDLGNAAKSLRAQTETLRKENKAEDANAKVEAAKIFEASMREDEKQAIFRDLRKAKAASQPTQSANATAASSDAAETDAPEAVAPTAEDTSASAETLVEIASDATETPVEAPEAAPAAEDTSASAETLVEIASDATETPVEAPTADKPKSKRRSKRAVAGA